MIESVINMTTVGIKVFEALRNPDVRIILMPGGTRSSKTFSIMQNLHVYMSQFKNTRVVAWRQKLTWARVSIIDDWNRKFIHPSGLNNLYKSVDTPSPKRTLIQNGSSIEFNGLDDEQKVHGVVANIHWINEGVEVDIRAIKQLLQRLENGTLIIDYNPSFDEHPIYELSKRPDCIVIHSTYKDNPFLPISTVNEIEGYEDTPENRLKGTVSNYHWTVYGLGLAAKREGLVFPDYQVIKEWDNDAKHLGNFLDFGFNDPTAFGRMGLLNGLLILDEYFYQSGLNNVIIRGREDKESIQSKFDECGIKKTDYIVADSAAKTSIHELRTCGYNIHPANKYSGSIVDGIKIMQQYMPFYITERSINLKKELDNYIWSDKNKNMPIDAYNHLLDGCRYLALEKLSNKYKKRKIIFT